MTFTPFDPERWPRREHFAVHSYDKPYYLPSVEAGQFVHQGGRTMLPLSVTCHHAATDGWHVQRFLKELQADMDGFEAFV